MILPRWGASIKCDARLAIPLAAFIALDAFVTAQNLPTGKIFAGHDSGFSAYYPWKLLALATSPWNSENALGYPDFLAPQALPYAVLGVVISSLHPSAAILGKIYFCLALAILQLGIFWLSWLAIGKASLTGTIRENSFWWHVWAASLAAIFASFNPYTAYLLTFPIISFQLGIAIWPFIIAYEVYILSANYPMKHIPFFVALLIFATSGNPAHVMLGFVLVLSIFLYNVTFGGKKQLLLSAIVALALLGGTAHIWLPVIGTATLIHGSTVVREALKYDQTVIFNDQVRESIRSSLSALLRFDGVSTWDYMPSSTYYSARTIALSGYAPILLSIVALLTRSRIAAALWIVLICGIEMAKDVHGPFPIYTPWLFEHVPGYATFRESYDKYMLLVIISMPTAAAIGLGFLATRRSVYAKGFAIAFALPALYVGFPFWSGRVANPAYQVTIPSEYTKVATILGDRDTTRVLTLPGNYLDSYTTSWFSGLNFENTLYKAQVVNGAIFKQRGISHAPLYNDDSMQFASDLPSLVRILGLYSIQYIVLHKDATTEFSRFARTSRVNGPLFARRAQEVLDRQPILERIFDGRYLAAYRMRSRTSMLSGSPEIVPVVGYENQMLALASAGLAGPRGSSALVFSGNSSAAFPTTLNAYRSSKYDVLATIEGEPRGLYPEQLAASEAQMRSTPPEIRLDGRPKAYVLQPFHGNYISGLTLPAANMSGSFTKYSAGAATIRVAAQINKTRRHVAEFFFGRGGSAGWVPMPIDDEDYHDSLMPYAVVNNTSLASTHAVERANFVTYLTSFQYGPSRDEGVAMKHTLPTISLTSQPLVTFLYDFPLTYREVARLRFDLRAPDGARRWFDLPLDNSGVLDSFDVRGAVQNVLNAITANDLAQHWHEKLFQSRESYLPPQADAYELTGVELILSKYEGTDESEDGSYYPFSMRALIVSANDPAKPAFEVTDVTKDFTGPSRRIFVSGKLSDVTREQYRSAEVLNATISVAPTPSPEPLPSNQAGTPPVTHALVRGSYSEKIAVTGTHGSRYILIRYLVGSPNEDVTMHLWFLVGNKVKDVPIKLQGNAGPDPAIGMSVSDTTYPPADRILKPGATSAASGWKLFRCDLRLLVSTRLQSLTARLTKVQINFAFGAIDLPPAEYRYTYGFGDVRLVHDAPQYDLKAALRGSSIRIDTTVRRPLAIRRDPGGETMNIDYGNLWLTTGRHVISTSLDLPFSATSVAVIDRQLMRLAPSAHQALPFAKPAMNLYSVIWPGSNKTILSFSQTYHPGWHLFRVDAPPPNRLRWLLSLRWTGAPTPEGDHFMLNAYANAWSLSAPGGTYVLDFIPQNLVYIGIFISALTSLASGLLAFRFRTRSS